MTRYQYSWIDFSDFFSIFSFALVLFGVGLVVYLISHRVWSKKDRKEGQRPGNYAPRRGSAYRYGPTQTHLSKPAPRPAGEARGYSYTLSDAHPYDAPRVELPAMEEEAEGEQAQEPHVSSDYASDASFTHEELRRMIIAKEILQRRAGWGRR